MLTRIAAAAVLVMGGAAIPATQASAADLTTMSASGCTGNAGGNGSKCIDVTGTGLHVKSVTATLTKNHADNCGRATISIGRNYVTTSGKICAASEFEFTDTVGLSFPDGTKACASWSNYPDSRACITIHK
ncbi:hypothetical protein AB0D04_25835 [Streptomyces sp. NPDC048483]|uniref:hypothetical protein n=1 Tax=Streptomyces sp. NPDC048483 TaxID=3154927 RepID=UPI00343EBB01